MNTGRVGSAALFRPCGVSRFADATSIAGVRFLAWTKNPLRTLSRRHSKTASEAQEALELVRGLIERLAIVMNGSAPDRI